jgi:hypothetical protein
MELMDWTLRASGWPDAKTVLEHHWVDAALPFQEAHFLDGFGTPDKKFHFAPDWSSAGSDWQRMPRLPDQWDIIEAATEDRPFRLVTSPARRFLNTLVGDDPIPPFGGGAFHDTAVWLRRDGAPTR